MSRARGAKHNVSLEQGADSFEAFLAARPPGDYFGDPAARCSNKNVRVLFQNVHGIAYKMMDEKQKEMFQSWKDENVGIALLAEMNLNWSHVKPGQGWYDRVRKVVSRGHYSRTAHNQYQLIPSPSAFQWGGCSATLLNETAHCARSSGVDPTGLGRWAWIKIRGTDKNRDLNPIEDAENLGPCDLVVVAAYRPSLSSTAGGVFSQQQNYFFDQLGTEIDPRKKFMEDLLQQIQEWKKLGCEIIIGLDANEDVSSNQPGSIRQLFRDSGLREAILSRHHGPYPATQQTNKTNTPIDGIFVTPGVAVKTGGYQEFHKYFSSDHRGIWIDIDLWSTLRRRQRTKYFQPRRLSTNDPRATKRYIKAAENGYLRYDIPRRLAAIAEDLRVQGNQLTLAQQVEFDQIHEQAYQVRRKAEQNCRKLRMGSVPWSPRLKRLWTLLTLWKLLLKGFRGIRTSSRKIRRLMKKTGKLDAWKMSEVDIQLELDQTRSTYRNAKKKLARKWRKKFIQASSSAPMNAGFRLQKRQARMNRYQRMEQKEETRRRRRAQGKGFSGGLTEIKVQIVPGDEEDDSNWVACSQKRLVEDGCMRENQARYDQTRSPFPTPPMTEPLYSAFNGPDAEGNSNDLLRGAFPSPNSDPFLVSFLNNCRRPEHLSPQHLSVTVPDHVAFWQKMGEQKGSEPHGLHNGHFKAGSTSSLLAQCDSTIRGIPFSTGFVPAQWKHLMNFAIEKKPGEKRVTKMRTIQMMNAEFQTNNKKVGKEAMAYAERHGLIPAGQFGSRKEHQAIDLALTKRLTWDLLILQRRAAGWISNDAKSCFDRIVHWVAIVSLMRFGIQWKTLRSMFDTLMLAAHRVRTGFGDSDRIFYPPSDIPFQGCGQGNGAGPTIWVAVSSILLGMMISKGFGFDFLSSISWASVLANAFAFVDDTDVCQAAPTVIASGEEIMPSVQQALTWWSEAINLSGGAINPSKSFWWLIDFRWDPVQGQWRFRRKADFVYPVSLRMKDLDGKLVALNWLEPDHSERTLGVMMSPQARSDIQYQVLLDKAADWAHTLSSARILRHDALPMLHTTILKTLEYPMALTTLSSDKWEKVLSKPLMVVLPKAGVCRTFPRAVVYAPIKRQGLGVPHPFGLQLSRHLDMLLRHAANHTKTGLFLQANLEAHQLETGTSYGLFQQVYSNTAILTSDTWVKRVWQGLDSLRIHVELDTPQFDILRENDSLLMEVFIDGLADQLSLKWLNWCRQYLHVVTVSDIVTADGKRITEEAWNGIRSDRSLDRFQWPRLARPAPKWWDIWRQFLSATLLTDSSSRRLRTPLGKWFGCDRYWRWIISPSTGKLFHLQGGGWIELIPRGRSKRSFYLPQESSFAQSVPSDCIRASVLRSSVANDSPFRATVDVESRGAHEEDEETKHESILGLWEEAKSQIAGSFGWVPESIIIQGDEQVLLQALLEGSLLVVCDGSFKLSSRVGTACAQLLTEDCVHRIWIVCRTPGLTKDQNSTRSELAGLLSSFLVLDWMCKILSLRKKQVGAPKVEVGCDGLCALQKSFDWHNLNPTAKQFDIVSTIKEYLRILPLSIVPRHIRGHADRYQHRDTLSWWEQRNMEVDEKAQSYRKKLEGLGVGAAKNPRFFREPASLFIHEVKTSRLDRAYLLDLVSIDKWTVYWADKGRLLPTNREEVDWEALARAMHSFPPNLQRWTVKHTVGMCGVGKFRQTWNRRNNPACPCCDECEIEDHQHVPRCRGETASATWNKYHSALRSWMIANHTAPEIQEFIFHYLRLIRSPTLPVPTVRTILPRRSLLQLAIRSQCAIGEQGLLEGLLSRHWRTIQQAHLEAIGQIRSVDLWASRLVQQLILLGRHMWENRNKLFHSGNNSHYLPRHREVDMSIAEQYRMGTDGLPLRARKLLSEPKNLVLLRPLEDREHWLRVVSRGRTLERRTLVRQRQMMYELLHRSKPSSQ